MSQLPDPVQVHIQVHDVRFHVSCFTLRMCTGVALMTSYQPCLSCSLANYTCAIILHSVGKKQWKSLGLKLGLICSMLEQVASSPGSTQCFSVACFSACNTEKLGDKAKSVSIILLLVITSLSH